MSVTKQSFGLLIATMTHWWGPTTIRISGDASVADQIRKGEDGLVEFSFPERMVMIANHQVRPEYTTNSRSMAWNPRLVPCRPNYYHTAGLPY